MPVEEQLQVIFEVLEGGASTPAGEVIQFPTDMAGAGATLEGTTTEVTLGNGVATEVSQLTVLEGGATETAGVGLLAMDVGAVGLALAPALGIIAGVGLYSLAPEFWTNVSNKLMEAGQTVGGKVRAFLNGSTKQAGLSKETIEIYKQAFIDAGLFERTIEYPDQEKITSKPVTLTSNGGLTPQELLEFGISKVAGRQVTYDENYVTVLSSLNTWASTRIGHIFFISVWRPLNTTSSFKGSSAISITDLGVIGDTLTYLSDGSVSNPLPQFNIGVDGRVLTEYKIGYNYYTNTANQIVIPSGEGYYDNGNYYMNNQANAKPEENPNVQEGATLPSAQPFPTTYPSWTPWALPEGLPEVYPIELPVVNPDATQEEAQSPEEIPDDAHVLEWLVGNFPQPQPTPDPYPQPAPNPDPDPQPEPDPIPEPEPEETDPNPIDPNPTPTPSPLPIIPDLPDTVESNAMFTVYKPSMTQVNAFGGWLWSTNIVEQIKRIWQNPLDGIISFMKVYVDAPTSGSDTIKVGVLDSEVNSPVVSGQFVTVECGSLNVSEKFYNATDYSPFVSMHLYLPFIGIVELDIDEFMSGEIKVTYHVDVYTGTCLAEVKSRRSPDMPEWTIVYTFSGNASQQLPLTSAEFSGALSSLVGVVGGGLAVASGGGLGLLAGASGIAHAVSHEMVHLAHSGSLSANAGIMGARTPYLILTRRRSYDANGYNELYGYPSNKTVFLNNCSGYVKIKDIRLKTSATDSERLEIINLLKAGVII